LIKRVAVVNRGEAALRFLQSARVADPPIEPVLLYTQADQESAAVRRYPESILLKGDRYSYENASVVIQATQARACDAVWLGWGFASEKSDFVQALEEAGLTVLAPRAKTLSLLGDKANALQIAQEAGFHINTSFVITLDHKQYLPSNSDHITTYQMDYSDHQASVLFDQMYIQLQQNDMRFPLLMKASEGGGGRGIFHIENGEHNTLKEVIKQGLSFVKRMQMKARFVIEEFLSHARHIEAQILGNGQGQVWVVGLRDCSVQRRKQKLIEECPPYQLPIAVQERMIQLATHLGLLVHYRSAGTVEMLYQAEHDQIHFLEVNPRLQVEHCVSEMVYGTDLVLAQIHLARQQTIPTIYPPRGVAIEARIYAEDPTNDFMPSPGRLSRFRIAHNTHVRVDTGFEEGDLISEDFDPLIAKVIAWGENRQMAIQRLQHTLMDSQILIEGGSANHHYLSQLLQDESYQAGTWHTQTSFASTEAPTHYFKIAIIASAIDQFLQKDDVIQENPNRHRQEGEIPLWIYRLQPQTFFVCERNEDESFNVMQGIVVEYHYIDAYTRLLKQSGSLYKVQRVYGDQRYWVQGYPYMLTSHVAGPLCAPSMGMVLSHEIKIGDWVEKGQTLLLLESMKVELKVDAPQSGWIRAIYAHIGEIVRPGQALLLLDAEAQKQVSTHAKMMIGEVDNHDHIYLILKAGLSAWDIAPCLFAFTTETLKSITQAERITLIEHFLDLAHLFDRRPRQYSEEKFGYSYVTRPLLLLDTLQGGDAQAVPENWRNLLQKVLHHLGVNNLKPSQELTESLIRLRRAQSQLKALQRLACLLFENLLQPPLTLLDRISSLDPDRFTDLISLADAHQCQRFADYQIRQLGIREQIALIRHLGVWTHDVDAVTQHIHKMKMSPDTLLHLMAMHALKMSHWQKSSNINTLDFKSDAESLTIYHEFNQHEIYLPQVLASLCVCLDLHHEVYALSDDVLTFPQIEHVVSANSCAYMAYLVLPNSLCIITTQGFIYLSKSDAIIDEIAIENFTDLYFNDSQTKRQEYPFIHLVIDYSELSTNSHIYDPSLIPSPLTSTLITSLQKKLQYTSLTTNHKDQQKYETTYTLIKLNPHQRWIHHYHLALKSLNSDNSFIPTDPIQKPNLDIISPVNHLPLVENLLPASIQRLQLNRWTRFHIEKIKDYQSQNIHIYHLQAKENSEDVRLIAYGEVTHLRRRKGKPLQIPQVDQVFYEALRTLHKTLKDLDLYRSLHWNRLILRILPVIPLGVDVIKRYVSRLSPAARWVGLEKVVVQARFVDPQAKTGVSPLMDLSIYNLLQKEQGYALRFSSSQALMPRSVFESRVVTARRRGLIHPREIINLLEGVGPIARGLFTLYDYDPVAECLRSSSEILDHGNEWIHLNNVDWSEQKRQTDPHIRDQNSMTSDHFKAPRKDLQKVAVIVGLIETPLLRPRIQLKRVVIISDPTIRMGALAEAECQRIIAAFDLASELSIPVEWVSVSSGARIDWETGTENLDACAKVLKRIIRFTKAGGMVNVIVPGICVGAQSYWNAEATMMMHCNGTLIMTDQGSMVLTGKKALEFSGCVAAQDELDLGGYTSVMGPNGQAQMHASDLPSAYRLLYRFYQLCYTESGHQRPIRMKVKDSASRNIATYEYPVDLHHGFNTIAEVFSELNQERKRPFSVRPVMQALLDQDVLSLERWSALQGGETAVVWHGRLDGYAVTVIGVENQPVQRVGVVNEGPKQWAGGTLYPQASRKVARAIRASQSRTPVIVLANLSGFDGSPESLRQWQLEYGSEIAQAVENFDAPIYFIVLSRYHGGAYVVFSKSLNPKLEALALHGSFASVIGGAPAAAVIFGREVKALSQKYGGGAQARSQALAEVAQRFDQIHDIHRALSVGSIDALVNLEDLREILAEKLAIDYQQFYLKPTQESFHNIE
jgi:acetyl/propionyl-CoA carboxylase alpha subunit/acetyl-CoA carboxylase carboxyltransferase component